MIKKQEIRNKKQSLKNPKSALLANKSMFCQVSKTNKAPVINSTKGY